MKNYIQKSPITKTFAILAIALFSLSFTALTIAPQIASANTGVAQNRDHGGDNGGNRGGNRGGNGGFTNPYTPSNNTYINTYVYPTPQYVNPYPVYQQPVIVYQPAPIQYYPPTPVYPVYNPLSASCSANTNYTTIGQTVVWNSYVNGGTGSYSYSWSGSDSIYGSNSNLQVSYNSPGQKYASLTVYSNGQSVTQECTNIITVQAPQPVYQYPPVNTYNNLTVGCAADTATARPGMDVTWSVEALGGVGPYSYSWSGSEGLSGSQTSVTTSYDYTGSKTASVTVRSADGNSKTEQCKAIKVVSGATAVNNNENNHPAGSNVSAGASASVSQATSSNASNLSANALFSLSNIPWGWIATLIILILIGVVMYLIFNRNAPPKA